MLPYLYKIVSLKFTDTDQLMTWKGWPPQWDSPPAVLAIQILNPSVRLHIIDRSRIPLGGRKIRVTENQLAQNFNRKAFKKWKDIISGNLFDLTVFRIQTEPIYDELIWLERIFFRVGFVVIGSDFSGFWHFHGWPPFAKGLTFKWGPR